MEFLHIYQPGFTDEPGSWEPPLLYINSFLPQLDSIVYNAVENRSFIAHEYLLLDDEMRDTWIGTSIDEEDLEDVELVVFYYELKENPDFVAIKRELLLNGVLKNKD